MATRSPTTGVGSAVDVDDPVEVVSPANDAYDIQDPVLQANISIRNHAATRSGSRTSATYETSATYVCRNSACKIRAASRASASFGNGVTVGDGVSRRMPFCRAAVGAICWRLAGAEAVTKVVAVGTADIIVHTPGTKRVTCRATASATLRGAPGAQPRAGVSLCCGRGARRGARTDLGLERHLSTGAAAGHFGLPTTFLNKLYTEEGKSVQCRLGDVAPKMSVFGKKGKAGQVTLQGAERLPPVQFCVDVLDRLQVTCAATCWWPSASTDEVRFGLPPASFPPYLYFDNDTGEWSGFGAAAMAAVATEVGVPFSFVRDDMFGDFSSLYADKFDCSLMDMSAQGAYSEGMEDWFKFTYPWFSANTGAMVRRTQTPDGLLWRRGWRGTGDVPRRVSGRT
ncbi:unnamed protein product [Prorocentrum cordatum]|uniref:Solute-binding protein family 3/N-terminal domain-containing protein n=1 Tax=Prorocentrum cordatum TaxID=2364126 RepID=A0ABN9XB23_9DINO|nr:unnamed protein product [Polarella glacialis]